MGTVELIGLRFGVFKLVKIGAVFLQSPPWFDLEGQGQGQI
jgi:hypothetical protein